jgi:hypothetical protein
LEEEEDSSEELPEEKLSPDEIQARFRAFASQQGPRPLPKVKPGKKKGRREGEIS